MPPVILSDYDPAWPALAKAYGRAFANLRSLLTVHHIGSTAVPGLRAKPVIDLMPVVSSLTALEQERAALEALGYVWRGPFGIESRRYCVLTDKAGVRRINAHFFAADSTQIARHLAFRDYLRAHPEARRAYEAEKDRALSLHPHDSGAYAQEKSAWIAREHFRASAWWAAQGAGSQPKS